MPAHDHPWANVTAVIRGEIIERTDSAEHRGRSCSVLLKPARTIHSNRAIGPGAVATIVIQLHPGSELETIAGSSRWSWYECEEAAHAALNLQRAFLLRSEQAVECAAQKVLATVLTAAGTAAFPAWMTELIGRIETDLDAPIRLDSIARSIGLHPVYVSRAFRRFTGTTLSEYVRSRRAGRARHLLSTTRRPLGAIAAECGFADASHLSKTFARSHELSPGAFRQICNGTG